jgi:thiosulfate dehydrogenase [quinone] large subunit
MKLNHKDLAYLLLRISLGIIFLFYGLGKFKMGPGAFADYLVNQFAKTPLSPAMVRLFGTVLPFAEVGLGALITLGLFTRLALALTALLLMALTFGMVFMQQPQTVAQNLLFSLVTFFLIFFLEHNSLAVDRLMKRRDTYTNMS